MSGFSAALNQLCAGKISVEAALAAFHREPSGNWNAFLEHSTLIESAWRAGKIDRPSYEALRKAVLTKKSSAAASADPATGASNNDAVFPSWSPNGPAPIDEPVRAERAPRDLDGTRMRTSGGKRVRAIPQSVAPVARPASSGDFEQITNPAKWPYGPPRSVGPGSVLKERFVLEEVIGRGGMGTIFRARDLRKEEAQDRHPYVAVKVLNEDFRKHPEALKALQRESRKAQALAHPNVASVYDFDRDGPLVFLVMELLEGVSLDQFIKSRVGRPLSQAEAMRVVQALCAALAHAHQKGLVHADFKPANAFRTQDGTVKVLDFGIARAIGHRAQEGDRTLFDPASLGALTPCYASPEMLVGDPPDPRDDVYALACVAYELLCSRHPFDFTSSLVAERNGMKPAPIPGLDRGIWRALMHGLAFSRANRTPSVEAFLAEFTPTRRSFRVGTFAAGVVALVAIGVLAWTVLPRYLNGQEDVRFATELRGGDPAVIDALIPQLLELPQPQLRALFDERATRDALVNHMERKIQSAIDPTHERVDYAAAVTYLDELDVLLPDSSTVGRLRTEVEARKQQTLASRAAPVQRQNNQRAAVAPARVPVEVQATPAATVSPPAMTPAPVASAGVSPGAPRPSLNAAQRKDRLLALAAANDLPEALELLHALKDELPASDAFLVTEAPNAISQTYVRLSVRAFDTGEFESAAALLARAAEFTPEDPSIVARRESVDRLGQVAHTIDNVISISADALNAELEHVQMNERERYPLIRTQLAEAFARRVTELHATSPQRAAELLKVGKKVFTGSAMIDNMQLPSAAERTEAPSASETDAPVARPE